ncbi:MAG TPA: HNH endonuclease [Pirellulales bacterium]|nr:HNH endonuclease [Pirellulales bacterium]
MIREEWGRLSGEFDLDHFSPQTTRPDLSTEYENLVYACHTCNLRKSDKEFVDPESCLSDAFVKVYPSGRVEGMNPGAKAIISKLGLDSPKFRKWRLIWIRNVELAKEYGFDHYKRLLGFPEDLPDLSALTPASNSKPNGLLI